PGAVEDRQGRPGPHRVHAADRARVRGGVRGRVGSLRARRRRHAARRVPRRGLAVAAPRRGAARACRTPAGWRGPSAGPAVPEARRRPARGVGGALRRRRTGRHGLAGCGVVVSSWLRRSGDQVLRGALLLAILVASGVVLGFAVGYPVSRIEFEESDAVRLDHARLAGEVDPAAALVTGADLPLTWVEGDPAVGSFGLL